MAAGVLEELSHPYAGQLSSREPVRIALPESQESHEAAAQRTLCSLKIARPNHLTRLHVEKSELEGHRSRFGGNEFTTHALTKAKHPAKDDAVGSHRYTERSRPIGQRRDPTDVRPKERVADDQVGHEMVSRLVRKDPVDLSRDGMPGISRKRLTRAVADPFLRVHRFERQDRQRRELDRGLIASKNATAGQENDTGDANSNP